MDKAIVLIINNDDSFAKDCEEKLRPYAEVYTCGLNHALGNFERMFAEKHYTHITVCGNENLAKIIRSVFSGPLIANSDFDECNDLMVSCGCSHKTYKNQTAELILGLMASDSETYSTIPSKKKAKEIKLEFAFLMVDFLALVKRVDDLEKAKELFPQLKALVKQRRNPTANARLQDIEKLLNDPELSQKGTEALAEIYDRMMHIYTLIC